MADPQSPSPTRPYDVIPLQAAPGKDAKNVVAFRSKTYPWGPEAPPTKTGVFSAVYKPYACILEVVVACKFTFIAGDVVVTKKNPSTGELYTAKEKGPGWTEAEKESWKETFMSQASQFWTGSHRFNCTSRGFESLYAVPHVIFCEAVPEDVKPMQIHVYSSSNKEHEIACKDQFTSCVLGMSSYLLRDSVNDMTARHEAGHMLGLGDEYAGSPKVEADHSALVEKEFGHKVIPGKVNTAGGQLDQASIMCDSARGTKILPEHGVVLLEVLRTSTDKQWQIQRPAVLKPDP